jgi:hypothetical protein
VLPLHGGPPLRSPRTRAVREQIHRILRQVIDRGRADGTVRQGVTPREIVVFGAMLAQPRGPDPGWDTTCRRLLATYLAGLGTPTPRLPPRRRSCRRTARAWASVSRAQACPAVASPGLRMDTQAWAA